MQSCTKRVTSRHQLEELNPTTGLTTQTIHETHFWSVFHKNVNPDNFIKRQPTNKYTVGKPTEEIKET